MIVDSIKLKVAGGRVSVTVRALPEEIATEQVRIVEQQRPFAEDRAFCEAFLRSKREAKAQFSEWLRLKTGQVVNPDTIFDCHVKRSHEYKRQLLNALRIVVDYNRLRSNPNLARPRRRSARYTLSRRRGQKGLS